MRHASKSKAGVVQLTIRRPAAGASTDSQFFTTWDVLERAGWRAADASRALQIAPSEHFGFRPFAQEFEVIADVQIARTIARANPEHGSGGGEKLFIPIGDQARALRPVGDLIVLDADDVSEPPKPTGFIADLINYELAHDNTLVGADRFGHHGSFRFWLQTPLHIVDLERALNSVPSNSRFQDLDPHGNTAGFVDADSQCVIAHFSPSTSKSWISRLFGR